VTSDFAIRIPALSPTIELIVDADTLRRHCTDYNGRNTGQALAIVRPGETGDVVKIVALCRQEGVAVVPQGGNTSDYGGSVPAATGRSIVLSLSRLNRILDIDLTNNTARVEAGVVLADLNRKLAEHDRWFPVSLGSEGTCQIGGNIAMNAGGNTVLRYGMMRDNLLGVEGVFGNGDHYADMQPLRKKCIGYHIGDLLVGSEGTLGVITKAILKLQHLPKALVTAWMSAASLNDALQTLDMVRQHLGERLTAFEVINQLQRRVIERYQPALKDPIAQDYEWAILAEFTDTAGQEALSASVEAALAAALEAGAISDALIAANGAQRQAFWRIRESVLDANNAMGWAVTHDASVPVSKLPAFAERVDKEVRAQFPTARFLAAGHAGDGNIHLGVFFEKADFDGLADFKRATQAINAQVFQIAHALGGHFSSEHGIGTKHRMPFLTYTPASNLALMRVLKSALDPQGIMNPGKIFDTAEAV